MSVSLRQFKQPIERRYIGFSAGFNYVRRHASAPCAAPVFRQVNRHLTQGLRTGGNRTDREVLQEHVSRALGNGFRSSEAATKHGRGRDEDEGCDIGEFHRVLGRNLET